MSLARPLEIDVVAETCLQHGWKLHFSDTLLKCSSLSNGEKKNLKTQQERSIKDFVTDISQ